MGKLSPKPNRGGRRTRLPQSATPQSKTIMKIAKKTANLKKEQFRVVDKDGNVVFTAKGDRGSVTMTVGDKRQYLRGNVTIHNHPDGGTFSSADLSDFGYGATEIVASTPEGTYRLINTKVGTPQQFDGWAKLREEYEKQPFNDTSAIALKRKAESNISSSREKRQMESISEQWVKERGNGASQERLDSLYKKFEDTQAMYKKKLQAEIRRLEVEPNHEWIKANAKKYGFKYVFEKR